MWLQQVSYHARSVHLVFDTSTMQPYAAWRCRCVQMHMPESMIIDLLPAFAGAKLRVWFQRLAVLDVGLCGVPR